MRPSIRPDQSSIPMEGLIVPDGVTTATDDGERPRLVGYVFLRDRIGWAILGVLVLQAALIAWIAMSEDTSAVRDLTAAIRAAKE